MIRRNPRLKALGATMKIIRLKEVDSTNEYCKKLNADCIVIADRQSGGKGTKGRSFESNSGGLYLSIVRRYDSFPAECAFEIMVDGCVAVCKTLEFFGIKPVIRWANDVLVDGRKICGTLIENTLSNGHITRSLVGCGINVNNELSADLRCIAVSMKEILGREIDKSHVERVFIENIQKHYSIADYKKYINWFSKSVILKTADGENVVTAVDVTDSGRLLVDWGGNMLEISSAEVSLRL